MMEHSTDYPAGDLKAAAISAARALSLAGAQRARVELGHMTVEEVRAIAAAFNESHHESTKLERFVFIDGAGPARVIESLDVDVSGGVRIHANASRPATADDLMLPAYRGGDGRPATPGETLAAIGPTP